MKTIETIYSELLKRYEEEKKIVLPRFFKTGKGEYGEGDKFLGVTVPNVRVVARMFKECTMDVVEQLLANQWHECRLCGLLILREKFSKTPKEVVDFYLSHTSGINNWDLVDLSAPYILGSYLVNNPNREILYTLAASEVMWENRIAIVATLMLIRNNQFEDTLKLAEILMPHKHDLMHKSIGWMLREVGKKDVDLLKGFLAKHCRRMPRIMLRYALEKFPLELRREFYL